MPQLSDVSFGSWPCDNAAEGVSASRAPTGPFTVLPYQVLVIAEPGSDVPIKAAPTRLEAYEGVAWLGTRQPITVLPSVASLKHLREHAKSVAATRPFIGFGNPLLTGRPDIASHRERADLVHEGLSCGQLTAPAGRRRLALEGSRPPRSLSATSSPTSRNCASSCRCRKRPAGFAPSRRSSGPPMPMSCSAPA